MELSQKVKDELLLKYNVWFNHGINAWVRNEGISKRRYELGLITEIITGENILLKGESYIDEKELSEDGKVCVCGCNSCSMLYRLYHKKTDIAFMVGSSCITRAGHPDFVSDLNCALKNGRCKKCNVPLRLNGKRKNTKRTYEKVCNVCRKQTCIYLNISFKDKDFFKQFGTKWDSDVKCWYWWGYEDEIPEVLKLIKKH
tara:strand:+ start:60 stop:659 length:600 start_codon:yes stop_codon:yes gene_type:complete